MIMIDSLFDLYVSLISRHYDIVMNDGWFLLILAMLWCVCRTLRADGVCESVLYGLPLVLHPTTCWQLDWDEIEANNNLFHGLCHTLKVFLSWKCIIS